MLSSVMLTPDELRAVARVVEDRGANYAQLEDIAPGEWSRWTFDGESGVVGSFTVDFAGEVV